MKKIEWFWNHIHYTFYKWDVNLSKVFSYLLPFHWINKITSIKRHKARNGMADMNGFYQGMMNSPKHGISISMANKYIGGIIVLFEFSICFVFEAFTKKSIFLGSNDKITYYNIPSFIIMLLIPYLINNQLLYKNNKYLEYFKEFDLMTPKERVKWGIVTFIVVLLTVGSFFLSLQMIHN